MDLPQIINRFQHLNRTRIERLSRLVSAKQQHFFKLLPFLLHTNVPSLPAYLDRDTPTGIVDYQADDETISAAQRYDPSFRHKRQSLRRYGLSGLYLINPYGLLNIPTALNFSLYVVHNNLTPEHVQALEHKLTLMTKWAQELGIKLDIHFTSEQALKSSPFSSEALEQFYLNGLILGGCIPLWWIVPPGQSYQQTAQLLTQQRHQSAHPILDFGDVNEPSAQALMNTSCHALSISIDSGLTHILSPLYSVCQLVKYPDIHYLSNDYKKAVYGGESEPLAIDIKVLQFTHILNSQLSTSNKNLAQKSLYIQAQEALSKKILRPKYRWRRDFIKQFSSNWQWAIYEIQILDQRDSATYQQCLEEHQQTSTAFTDIHATIKQFSLDQPVALTENSVLLEQRLQANDSQPNIIQPLPQHLAAKTAEETLHLARFHPDKGWKLSLTPLSSERQKSLYQHDSLIHIIVWAIFNGLLSKETRMLIADKTSLMTIKTLLSLVQQLLRMPLSHSVLSSEHPAKLDQIFLFANLEQREGAVSNQQGHQLTSLHNDPFNYANRGESLLYSIDGLICSTSGQWQTFQTRGKVAPLDLFNHLIAWWLSGKNETTLNVYCFSDAHGQSISHRLQGLYAEVHAHYHDNISGCYFILVADTVYQLSWQPEGFDITELRTTDINAILPHSKSHFAFSKLDAQLDPTCRLTTLLGCQSEHTVSLIIEQKNHATSLYILDEFGNLMQQADLDLTPHTTLNNFQHFLSIIKKNKPKLQLRYFKIESLTTAKPDWKLVSLSPPLSKEKPDYLPVIITLSSPTKGAQCTIKCGSKQFSGRANGKALFEEVASFILSVRKSNIPYQLYINEIHFSDPAKVTTIDYLRQKQYFEKHLNLN